MKTRFLCGPAGSGKTFRCLAEIRASLQSADGPPLVFIVPKQSTFQLERQLLEDRTVHGYTRLHILSFERLAKFVFERFNLAVPKFINDEGRVMVLRALLLRHQNELKLFRSCARRPGLAQEVGGLLAEFQQHQVSPAQLRSFAKNQTLRAELRDKLLDLALLFDHYLAWLKGNRLRDENRLLDEAAELLRMGSRPADLAKELHFDGLWMDGFAEMTPQEMDLLTALLPYCSRATLAFCLRDDRTLNSEASWLSIWSAVGNTFQRCRERVEHLGCEVDVEMLGRDREKSRFAQSDVLRHLEANWDGERHDERVAEGQGTFPPVDETIRVVICPNPEVEAILAAREIAKFVRAGNRYRDCAVLVRNLQLYHKSLSRTFRRYGIPFFLDRRASITHHPLAELTRNALRLVAFDWQHEDWFAALKTGFCRADEMEIDALENESLARGWRGKRWREPIAVPTDRMLEERLERVRRKIVPPFEIFVAGVAESKFRPDGKQLAGLIRDLWTKLDVEETLEGWKAMDLNKSRGRGGAAIHSTVWDALGEWLATLELAFSHEAMHAREWLPVVEAGLAHLTVGVIPPALDEVLIGAVDRARNPELKFSLVLGLNDTVFPAAPAPSAILTDMDRQELYAWASLGPDLRERLSRERYYGYIAFTRAHQRMLASFSRSDCGGAPLAPSPFIKRLQMLFPAVRIEEFDNQITLDAVESINEMVPQLIEWQNAELSNSAIFRREQVSRLLNSLADLGQAHPLEQLSPAMAERLYGPIFRTSVSRLEEFAQCPFKFFVRSGLKAGERKVFELDARERGTFQHEVLKAFHEQLVAENRRWRDLTPAQARQRVGQIAAELAGDYHDGLLRHTGRTRFDARAMTESLQNFIEVIVSWMREQYEFDPAAVELAFGEKDSPLPAWPIPLDGGRQLLLRGRIDRVDLCKNLPDGNARFVVLDYKSSPRRLDSALVENGIQLQLPAYLSALSKFADLHRLFGVEKLVPAGVFYVNLRGQPENGKTRADILKEGNPARRAAYRHTGRFDAGMLHKLDSAGAQDQFQYSRKQDGTLRKGTGEALAQADFGAWLEVVETQLRRIGNEIFSGKAQVDPYRKGRETACDYCDYATVCRIDAWTHRFRTLAAKDVSTE